MPPPLQYYHEPSEVPLVRFSDQFRSSAIQPEGTFERTFDRVGKYPYHCDIHPWMKGIVTIGENYA